MFQCARPCGVEQGLRRDLQNDRVKDQLEYAFVVLAAVGRSVARIQVDLDREEDHHDSLQRHRAIVFEEVAVGSPKGPGTAKVSFRGHESIQRRLETTLQPVL